MAEIMSQSISIKLQLIGQLVFNRVGRLIKMSCICTFFSKYTWELTVFSMEFKLIRVKWLFKIKLNKDGNMVKLKARLVEKGYTQCHKIDYTKLFSPVARLDTNRVILAMVAQLNWKVFQLDMKCFSLQGVQ